MRVSSPLEPGVVPTWRAVQPVLALPPGSPNDPPLACTGENLLALGVKEVDTLATERAVLSATIFLLDNPSHCCCALETQLVAGWPVQVHSGVSCLVWQSQSPIREVQCHHRPMAGVAHTAQR